MVALEHFFSLLKDAARCSEDTGTRCTQLQAFRAFAVDSSVELNSETLGASLCDRDKPYFWSRKWERGKFTASTLGFEYPALLVYERPGTRKHPFSLRSKMAAPLEIGVIDAYSENCLTGDCAGCNGRTIHEIYRDTGNLLAQVLRYLGGSVLAKVNDGPAALYNLTSLQTSLDALSIEKFEVVQTYGAILEATKEIEQFRIDYPGKKLFGTAVVIPVELIDCENCVIPSLNITTTSSCCQ